MSTINLAGGNTLLSTGAFPPVRAASTGSALTPATGGLLTVDGITLAVGDRVLVKDETSAVNNGIYAAQTGPWTRVNDAQTNTQFFPGMTVTVGPGGAVNAGQTYVCTTTDDPVVVSTSQITWASQAAVQNAQQTATSTTSLTVGTGTQTLAIQAGKAFQANQEVLIYETSNTANSMLGQITSYTGTSLVVSVTNTAGSGTHTDWTVVLYNSVAAAGITPPIGTGNVSGPGSSTTGHIATFADATGKVLSDGGAPVGGANSITPMMFANAAVGYALGMLNGTLVASVAANALTITVKTLAGATPSSSDPVFFLITNGSGGWTVIEQTSALSLTVPASATLGTVSGQTGRQWVGVFNNSGAAILGIYNSLNSSAPSILCWNEQLAVNATGITSGSTSPQLWYAASTLSSVKFRVIGYVESTQATAGQWASTVTPYLFGPSVKKPGDTYGPITAINATGDSTSSATFVVLPHNEVTITPTSAANAILVEATGNVSNSGASGSTATLQLSRGTTNATGLFGLKQLSFSTSATAASTTIKGIDQPNTASATTYALQGFNSNTLTFPASGGSALLAAQEIQI